MRRPDVWLFLLYYIRIRRGKLDALLKSKFPKHLQNDFGLAQNVQEVRIK